MTLLSLRDVTVTVRMAGTEVDLLRRVSLELPAGGVLGLVGESGAGKSMVGRLIARLLPDGFRVTSGSMLFEGVDLLAQPATAVRRLLGRRIAFIPQEPSAALDPVRTIGWQFGQHLARLGLPRDRALPALAEVGLRDPAGVLAEWGTELPAGTKIRVLDSTADYRWMVLPLRPAGTEGWDAARLAAIVTEGDMIGVSVPKVE